MEIHYVVGQILDKKDPILRKLIEFCEAHDVLVTFREFDSFLYEEDGLYITDLPAIQLYKHKVYEDTFYPNYKPIQFLRVEFEKFELEQLEREAKRQIWESRIAYLKSVFYSSKTDSKVSKSDR
jgi:hypothetical protein